MSQNWKILAGILLLAGFGAWIFVSLNKDKTVPNSNNSQNEQQDNNADLTQIRVEVPIYTPSDLDLATENESSGSRDYTVSLLTDSSIDDVNSWYRKELSMNGWHITGDNNVGGYQIIKGEKDNYYTSIQAAGTGDDRVRISQQIKIRK